MSNSKKKRKSNHSKKAVKPKTAENKKPSYDRERDNQLKNEIITIGVVGVSIFLVLCNFHLCSGIGEGIYSIMHGLIGCLAYVLPFAIAAVRIYFVYTNEITNIKWALISIIAVLSTGIFHIIGIDETKPFSLIYFFTEGQRGINGGVLGGITGGVLQMTLGTTSAILILLILILIAVVLLTEKSVLEITKESAEQLKKAGTDGRSKAGVLFDAIKEKMPDDIFHSKSFDEEMDEEEEDNEPVGAYPIKAVFDSAKQKLSSFFNKEQPEDRNSDSRREPAEAADSAAEMRKAYQQKEKRKPIEMPIDLRKEREIIVEKEEELSEASVRVSRPEGIRKEEVSRPEKLPTEKLPEIFIPRANRTEPVKTTIRPAEAISEQSVKVYETPISTAAKSGLLEDLGFSNREYSRGKKETPDAISKFVLYDGSSVIQAPVRMAEQKNDESSYEQSFSWMESEDEKPLLEEDAEENLLSEDDEDENLQSDDEEMKDLLPEYDESKGMLSEEEDFQSEDEEMEGFPFEKEELEDTLPEEDESWNEEEVSIPGAVDLNAHVVLEEDMPASVLSDMGNPKKPASESSIWKSPQDRRAGSGAVTFSPKPSEVVRPAKPVKSEPYEFPPARLLTQNRSFSSVLTSHHREIKEKLQETLSNFGVHVIMRNVSVGPTVTRYELEPEPGVTVNRIVGRADDIKLALAAADIRIEAPIPGKSAVGIEVPNPENSIVGFRELIEAESFQKHPSKLAVAIGRDIGGQIIIADLAKMPHLLIAGATGSGKSVCINTLIMSLLYKASPDDVKIIMIDPKVVELSIYNGIPHLLVPVVTDPRKAANALQWAVEQMNSRYRKFAEYNVRNLQGYNDALKRIKETDPENQEPFLYQMVIIVDELADLMMVSPGEVEAAICRLAQMARAAGIHLVLATQRPSVNVITGLIKANVPSRIAFAVSSGVDSRTIIDMNGAEKLLGKGDMLFYPYGIPKPTRVQGAFISDEEVSRVVEFLQRHSDGPSGQEMMERMITSAGENSEIRTERDEYFEKAGFLIIEKDKATIGLLQRHFKIGFNRAARLMDQLAGAGVVGEEEGTKARKILMSREEFEEFLASAH